jgi:hypothetical protein
MGTKIIQLPPTNEVLGDGYIPISQDPTGSNRVTYKVTAQQIATYIGATTSSGTVNNVAVECTDGSLAVAGSPITTRGIINVSVNSITLDKINSGGATNGQVLTYDGIVNQWKPIDSSNTGVTADSVQIGTVLWFAASSAPLGYLECNGSSKKISDYPELAVVLGTTYGNLINGGTEFILPDLRGEFIRGWSHGKAGVDTGRIFGSWQKGTIVGHDNTPSNYGVVGVVYTGGDVVQTISLPAVGLDDYNIADYPNIQLGSILATGATTSLPQFASNAGSSGTTRPRNVALLPCIKAIKTVTATSTLLNFIEKPSGPLNNDVLYYNQSTSTWLATSFNAVQSITTRISNIPDAVEYDLTGGKVSVETAIPSYTKRITIVVEGLSMDKNKWPIIKVKSSAGYNNSTYTGVAGAINDSTTAETNWIKTGAGAGMKINANDRFAATINTGQYTLSKLKEGRWHFSGICGQENVARMAFSSGRVEITGSAPITHIQIASEDELAIFDGGKIYFIFE